MYKIVHLGFRPRCENYYYCLDHTAARVSILGGNLPFPLSHGCTWDGIPAPMLLNTQGSLVNGMKVELPLFFRFGQIWKISSLELQASAISFAKSKIHRELFFEYLYEKG